MNRLYLRCYKAGALLALDYVVNYNGIAKRYIGERSVNDNSDGDKDP